MEYKGLDGITGGATNPPGQGQILHHDGDPLGMDGTQVPIGAGKDFQFVRKEKEKRENMKEKEEAHASSKR